MDHFVLNLEIYRFDKGLLAPGKKLYKQVKGTSGKEIVQKHKAIGSQTVCEKEFQVSFFLFLRTDFKKSILRRL